MKRPNPSVRCHACISRDCAPHWLYVVEDTRDGAVKIGLTKNVSQRIGNYRANGCTYFNLRHKQIAGCYYSGAGREAKALRALSRLGARRGGDWFFASASDAAACVADACGDYTGACWQ